MPSSHERSLLETHIPGWAKQPWAALAGCRTSLVGKQMQQPGCLGCLLTLLCALLLGIEQDGAGPRVPEHPQPQRQTSCHAQGSSYKIPHLLISLPRTWYWAPPLLPEKRFQGHNIDLQAVFRLFMFTGPWGKMPLFNTISTAFPVAEISSRCATHIFRWLVHLSGTSYMFVEK